MNAVNEAPFLQGVGGTLLDNDRIVTEMLVMVTGRYLIWLRVSDVTRDAQEQKRILSFLRVLIPGFGD